MPYYRGVRITEVELVRVLVNFPSQGGFCVIKLSVRWSSLTSFLILTFFLHSLFIFNSRQRYVQLKKQTQCTP